MTRHAVVILATVLLLAGCGGSSKAKPSSLSHSGGWSTLDLSSTLGAGENVTGVSCPTTGSFCMILAANASYTSWKTVTYRAGKLGSASPLHAGPGAVLACASRSYCVSYTPAENIQSYSVWNGSSWHAYSTGFKGEPSGADLTCPSSGLCVAIGNDGSGGKATLLFFTPGAVSDSPFDDHGQTLIGVTCASVDLCLLSGDHGDLWAFVGLTHLISAPTALTVSDSASAKDPVNEVSCSSGPYCIGVGTGGGVVADSGKGFHRLAGVTVLGGTGLGSFAGTCGSASFCLVPTKTGYGILDGDTLTAVPAPPAKPAGGFSCTATRLCMDDLATASAKVLVYRGA